MLDAWRELVVRGGRPVPLLAAVMARGARVSGHPGETDAERVIKQGLLKLLNPSVDLVERKREEMDGRGKILIKNRGGC